MKTKKKLGIWMDHASANLMEFTPDPTHSTVITSKFTHEQKEHSLAKGETQMHNKEQHLHAAYYQKLIEVIRNYDDVILFGPTDAKVELFNLLIAANHFAKIEIKQADKMTENQQHAFVKEYFSKKLTTVQ